MPIVRIIGVELTEIQVDILYPSIINATNHRP